MTALLLASLAAALAQGPASPPAGGAAAGRLAPDGSGNRLHDLTADWQANHRAILGPFHNCYNARVVYVPGSDHPYRMWFFGWPVADNNPVGGRFIGDAIYAARSKDLLHWQVYAGDDAVGHARWASGGEPKRWVPVVSALDPGFENAIAGDPAVVRRGDWYYMAFSSVWFESHPETTPQHMWVIACIMGARSRDGLHWERTRKPILIWSKEYQVRMDAAGGVFKTPKGYYGSYQRPSLMYDEGRWRLWFDYFLPGTFVSLGYAENRGDFMDPAEWRVLNSGDHPQLRNWPNASVVKVGGLYYNFSDAPNYPAAMGGDGRQITMAESTDGHSWRVLGHVRPEGRASSHVPEAFLRRDRTGTWLYVFYAWKPETKPGAKWDYRYKEIRYLRRRLDAEVRDDFSAKGSGRAKTGAAGRGAAARGQAVDNGSEGGCISPRWQPETPAWVVRDGVYEQTDASLYGTTSYLRRPVFADVTISVRFKVLDEGPGVRAAGLVFRSAGAGREYWAHFDTRNQQLLLQRETGPTPGAERALKRVPLRITVGQWHRAKVECRGAQIRVSFDGRVVLRASDDTFLAGRVGLRAGQGHVLFDDFRATGTRGFLARPWEMRPAMPKHHVVCKDAGAGGYQAFPDLVRLQDGDLLCVFYAGYGHISLPTEDLPRGSRVCSVRSTDGGQTWGPAEVVADTPWDDRDPSVCQLRDGTLLCNWFTYYPPGAAARPGNPDPYKEIWLARSPDNGHTWSQPELIPATAGDHYGVSSPIRQMPDGTLVMPIYRELPNPLRNWSAMILSKDGGRTWSKPQVVDPDNDDNDEPDVVALPGGRLLCVMRSNRGDRTMWESTSTDGGRTWAKSKPIGFPGQSPYLLRTSQGILLLAHRLPGTSLHYSLDNGKTWSKNVEVDTCIGAYPSMVEMPDGSILMVYYEEGEGSEIRAVSFRATKAGIVFEK